MTVVVSYFLPEPLNVHVHNCYMIISMILLILKMQMKDELEDFQFYISNLFSIIDFRLIYGANKSSVACK